MDESPRIGPDLWSWISGVVRRHLRALAVAIAIGLAWIVLAGVLAGIGVALVVSSLCGFLARWTGDPVLAEGLTGLALLLLAGLAVRLALGRCRS